MVANYGLRLRISQQDQSIEQWASFTPYTSIYPLISHLSCPSSQSVSILHKGLNAAFGARLIYNSAGRNPVNLFLFCTCVSIDRSIDLYSYQKRIQHYGLTLWLFNIAMENGPFIDGSVYLLKMVIFHGYVK